MRYSQIRSMDISNGENIGVSLFTQGCPIHCKNCFNSELWNFDCGNEWTEEIKHKFFELIDKPYIKRVSVLGGEPLAKQNYYDVRNLIKEIKNIFPEKTIWLYTGYTFENLSREQQRTIIYADILVDGEYIDELKDQTLKWRGSSNQRVIDIQETLKQNKIVLYCN